MGGSHDGGKPQMPNELETEKSLIKKKGKTWLVQEIDEE